MRRDRNDGILRRQQRLLRWRQRCLPMRRWHGALLPMTAPPKHRGGRFLDDGSSPKQWWQVLRLPAATDPPQAAVVARLRWRGFSSAGAATLLAMAIAPGGRYSRRHALFPQRTATIPPHPLHQSSSICNQVSDMSVFSPNSMKKLNFFLIFSKTAKCLSCSYSQL